MKAAKRSLVYLLAIPLLLAACSAPAPTGTLAGTPTGALPQVLIVGGEPATYTVVPTYTPPATYTPVPTYTPAATFTPRPTFTPLLPELPAQATRQSFLTPVPVDLSDLEQRMLEVINAERAQAGLGALVADAVLTGLARGHAQDMVDRGYRDHVTPEGVSYDDRLAELGIEGHWRGENWYTDNCAQPEIVACAMEWSMADSSHRANILHEHYRRIGIGIVEAGPDRYVIVEDFIE